MKIFFIMTYFLLFVDVQKSNFSEKICYRLLNEVRRVHTSTMDSSCPSHLYKRTMILLKQNKLMIKRQIIRFCRVNHQFDEMLMEIYRQQDAL
jgi:hypothetical protein